MAKDQRRSCGKMVIKWYYDSTRRQCRQFWYSNCGEKGNHFASREECQRACTRHIGDWRTRGMVTEGPVTGVRHIVTGSRNADICLMPKDQRRSCGRMVIKWYYEHNRKKCMRFWYSNCGDAGNHFDTDRECQRTCYHQRNQLITTERVIMTHNADVCSMKKSIGHCTNWQRRWYYNKAVGRCEMFWHGGCGSHGNVFDTREVCESRCVQTRGRVTQTPVRTGRCVLAPKQRNCGKFVIRWNYNPQHRYCERFWFGQCGSPPYVYDTQASCQQHCSNVISPEAFKLRNNKSTKAPEPEPEPTVVATLLPVNITEDLIDNLDNMTTEVVDNENTTDAEMTNTSVEVTTGMLTVQGKGVVESGSKMVKPDICLVEVDTRRCQKYRIRWRYSALKGCVRFWDGGCTETGNVFNTQADCARTCGDRRIQPYIRTSQAPVRYSQCRAPKDQRFCVKWSRKWYYDTETSTCKLFYHGGCRENGNVFTSRSNCEYSCRAGYTRTRYTGYTYETSTSMVIPSNDVCIMEKDSRRCGKKMLVRWYYDRSTQRCRRFWFGQCYDHGNMFLTERDCQHTCRTGYVTRRPTYMQTKPVTYAGTNCLAPKDERFCVKWTMKWHYDQATKSCKQFYHGGCPSNGNEFVSRSDCFYRCINQYRTRHVTAPAISTRHSVVHTNVCSMEKDSRRCGKKMLVRWYYDRSTQRCRRFWFGQCYDRSNMFLTERDCQHTCRSGYVMSTEKTIVTESPRRYTRDCGIEPTSQRLCTKWVIRWHYSHKFGACRRFWSGSCPDVFNGFSTQYECRRYCLRSAVTESETGIREVTPEGSGEEMTTDEYEHSGSAEEDCADSKYGCCPDGITVATDINFKSCPAMAPSVVAFDTDTITVVEGSRVHMKCQVRGAPRPRVNWLYNRRTVVPDGSRIIVGKDNTLILNQVQSSDTGSYSCRASSPSGEAVSKRRQLYVTEATRKFAQCRAPKDQKFCTKWTLKWHYDQKTATCRQFYHGGCRDNGNVFESRNRCHYICLNSVIPQTSTSSPTIDECIDAPYGCCPDGITTARDAEFKSCPAMVPAVVAFNTEPITVYDGTRVTMKCNARGAPKPTITWLRNGMPLQLDGRTIIQADHTLVINSVSPLDSGRYRCRANNRYGHGDSSERTLRVLHDRVDTTSKPVRDSDVYVPPGDTVYLNCRTTGEPLPSVTWYHNRKIISDKVPRFIIYANGTLRIVAIQMEDGGSYMCVGRNRNGETDAKTVRVLVSGEVRAQITSEKQHFSLGDVLSLKCQATGAPHPDIEWFHGDSSLTNSDRVKIDATGILRINDVSYADSGVYSCKASNGIRSDTVSRIIRVSNLDIYGKKNCKDLSSRMSCLLIRGSGLCRQYIFYKSCCKTCGDHLRSLVSNKQ